MDEMSKNFKTTRIWEDTLKKLRWLSAVRGDSQVEILDHLVEKEYERLRRRGDFDEHSSMRDYDKKDE